MPQVIVKIEGEGRFVKDLPTGTTYQDVVGERENVIVRAGGVTVTDLGAEVDFEKNIDIARKAKAAR